MVKKYGKFYAGWSGADGKRHVKACKTKTAAARIPVQLAWQLRLAGGHPSKRSRPPAEASPCFLQFPLSLCKEKPNEACRISAVAHSFAGAAAVRTGPLSLVYLLLSFPHPP